MLSRLPSSPTKGVFSFYNPQEDLLEYLKACAPIACQDYGKTISHYGGLRITPEQDVEYAGWSKAKQLAWDRAYDENNELCYICYNGAGNSAYAGFMKILRGRKRRETLQWSGLSARRVAGGYLRARNRHAYLGNEVSWHQSHERMRTPWKRTRRLPSSFQCAS